MSSKIIIEKTINELRKVMIDALTGTSFNVLDDKYKSLRRRMLAYRPIIGDLPEFLRISNDLYELWHNTTTPYNLHTYDARRSFIQKNYQVYYENIINNFIQLSFEEELLRRDLTVEDQIGSGGFGIVYKAYHVVMDEYRAIKKLDPLFANEEGELTALRRFAREIKILNDLDNNNIIKVLDAGIANENPFYVMEYFQGQNLQQYINDHGAFSESDAIKLMIQILDGVAHAHEIGTLHRDIKPTNILWNGEKCKILDFGAGQWITERLSTRMTTSAIGTAGYIAPELLSQPELIDKRIDCYSLGIVFHFLLTNGLPSTGNPRYYLSALNISEEIVEFIVQSISNIEARQENAGEMYIQLKSICGIK